MKLHEQAKYTIRRGYPPKKDQIYNKEKLPSQKEYTIKGRYSEDQKVGENIKKNINTDEEGSV